MGSKKTLFFDSEEDIEDENLEQSLNNFPISTTILLNKITNTNNINHNNNLKQLCDSYIKSEHTKIVGTRK